MFRNSFSATKQARGNDVHNIEAVDVCPFSAIFPGIYALAAFTSVAASGMLPAAQAAPARADTALAPAAQVACSSDTAKIIGYQSTGGVVDYSINRSCVYADPCSSANSTVSTFNPLANATVLGCGTDASYSTTPPGGGLPDYKAVDSYTATFQNEYPGTGAAGDSTNTPTFVAYPDSSTASSGATLVLFLGGTSSKAAGYSQFAMRSAYNGFAAISVPYPNVYLAGQVCNYVGPCYSQFDGAIDFGYDVAYAPGATTYGSTKFSGGQSLSWSQISSWQPGISSSIVGLTVAALDAMVKYPPTGSTSAFWSQFLTTSSDSPYPLPSTCGSWTPTDKSKCFAYPKWSQIVLAGHSQGGDHAAFLATHLPAAPQNLVQRVIMMSSPDDCQEVSGYADCVNYDWTSQTLPDPANWLSQNVTGITKSQFRGLRHGFSNDAIGYLASIGYFASYTNGEQPATAFSDEGAYGNDVDTNWTKMIAPFAATDSILDSGMCLRNSSCSVGSSHKFVITKPDTVQNSMLLPTRSASIANLLSHDSTAADPNPAFSILDPSVAYVWDKLLLGN